MEPHVKERIVGAAIIVALGVWLIPWVLDGPEDAGESRPADAGDILPAAADAAPIRTETVELDPAVPDAPISEAAENDAPERVAVLGPAAEAAGAARESGDSAKSDAGAPTQQTPASPSVNGGWAVQLGAFGDVANARQLASRVSTYGYSAYVSDFLSGGQTMHRVRVGGFDTETQADAALSSLSAHGFPGRVIPPE